LELGISDGIQVQVINGISKDDKIKVWNIVKPSPEFAGN
jgi:HlyD family secretion protein